MNVVSATATLPMNAAMLQSLTLIGQTVTAPDYSELTFTVHAIEGDTWYAFNQDGRITVDTDMTGAYWISEPRVTIIPVGTKIGEGFSREVLLSQITPVTINTAQEG